jgi:hypothetical protein
MHYLHIEACVLVSDDVTNIIDKLKTEQTYYDTENVYSEDRDSIGTQICLLLQKNTHTEIRISGNEYICTIGKQGRYLLYTHEEQVIPRFMFILVRRRMHKNKDVHSKHNIDRDKCKKPHELGDINDTSHSLRIFSCTGEVGSKIQQTGGGGMNVLLKSMSDDMVDNEHILKNVHAYTRQMCRSPGSNASLALSCSDIGLAVCVTEDEKAVSVIPVLSTGLQCARNALRNTGALYHTHVQNSPAYEEEIYTVVIAQNREYTVSMVLYAGKFHLRLQKTEELFECSTFDTTPTAIITMSHKFHSLDSVVEHISTRNMTHQSNTRHIRVSGMLAVTHELLRLNVVSAPVRSMGSNYVADMYTDMCLHDITQALRVMCLITDNKRVANSLNKRYPGVVVKHVCSKDLLHLKDVSNTDAFDNSVGNTGNIDNTDLLTDFRIHRSGVLNYAIAHQNVGVTSILNRTMGVGMQEISTAIYSGISFCHACAYGETPMETEHGVRVHLINGSDFPEKYTKLVHKLVETETLVLSSAASVVRWSKLRHNFHVQESANRVTRDPLRIECHATESGLVFFRRVGQALSHVEEPIFFGAVYMIPSLARGACHLDSTASPMIQQPDTVDVDHITENPEAIHSATRSHRAATHPMHRVVHLVSQLASQATTTDVLFLRNATETLFHINSICIHNSVSFKNRTQTPLKLSKFISPEQHQKLRQVWLHTHTSKAYKFCGRSQKTEFYRIYAHLSNLAALPLDSAGYWHTIPYV